jgi:hypothetical protein
MVTGGGDRGGPRVKVKWPVTVTSEKGSMEGVTLDLALLSHVPNLSG